MTTTADFHAARREFRAAMALCGMDRDGAGADYCISMGRRLRDIYSRPIITALDRGAIEKDEAEALTAFTNFLARTPCVYKDGGAWSFIVGGKDVGDATVLYVVPPGVAPIVVPLPPVGREHAEAQQVEDAAARVEADSEVQKILDAWNNARPKKEPIKLEDVMAGKGIEFEYVNHNGWRNGAAVHDGERFALVGEKLEAHRLMEQVYEQIGVLDKAQVMAALYGGMGMDFELARQREGRHQRDAKLKLDRLRAEMEDKAIRLGWSKKLRETPLYLEFVECMIDVRKAMEQHDKPAVERYRERGRVLCERLQRQHMDENGQGYELPRLELQGYELPRLELKGVKGLDHLREKEHRKSKRRAKK